MYPPIPAFVFLTYTPKPNFLYDLSKEGYLDSGYTIKLDSQDVYGDLVHRVPQDLREALEIITYYEKRWLSEGKKIHFIQLEV